ncbi:DUF6221 family protein [Streptomyces erythrochromogenes]|uniref:DUF6221 family protein n=1 Tax=Streptomyces erythrochromogenes TaxID=285574 RepID=UPI002256C613|nr:DUF6221 family protein [Streptomyces erythrochromogenes]MCX5587559.1 DUF6221 family protein [Streptomyces erythrochromogenes]
MDDFVQFLRARLDEDEQVARAATPGPWSVNDKSYAESIDGPNGVAVVGGSRWGGEASVFESTEDALHIAEHNPARVLAEVDAKRRLLDEHPPARGWDGKNLDGPVCRTCAETGTDGDLNGDPYPCTTLRLLALPYADRPGYREEWRPAA